GVLEDVEAIGRRGGAHTDLAVSGDVDRAGRRAGTDAERKAGDTGHVANEEVRLVARDVPGLRGEAAGVVLLEAHRRGVAGGDVQVEDRRGGAEADAAGAVDEDRVRRRGAGDGKRNRRGRDVFDGELVRAAAGGVVPRQLPVVVREAGRGRRVVELDAGVVLFQANRVEAERLVVHAIEADAETALDDRVIGRNDVVRSGVELRVASCPERTGGVRRRSALSLRRRRDEGAARHGEDARLDETFSHAGLLEDLRGRSVIAALARVGERLPHVGRKARRVAELERVGAIDREARGDVLQAEGGRLSGREVLREVGAGGGRNDE